MLSTRCGNFSIEVEELTVPGAGLVLRVPLRRCALAEDMIARLSTTEQGGALTRRLRIAAREPGQDDGAIRAAFGPDLEAIHAGDCTVERCRESCSPGYWSLLAQFHMETEPATRDMGCLPVAEVSAETLDG